MLILQSGAYAQNEPSATYSNPFEFCQALKNIDNSEAMNDKRYAGDEPPKAIADALKAAPIAWRCMDGEVYGCYIGASGRACMQMNGSRSPPASTIQFCTQSPNSDFVPMSMIGNSASNWRCQGATPIAIQTQPLDKRGFMKAAWIKVLPTSATERQLASFDCSTAKSASARLICNDEKLAGADGALGSKFKAALSNKDALAKKQFIADQLAWLRARNSQCGVGPDKSAVPVEQLSGAKPCMLQAINERIAFLTTAEIAPTATATPAPANRLMNSTIKDLFGTLPPLSGNAGQNAGPNSATAPPAMQSSASPQQAASQEQTIFKSSKRQTLCGRRELSIGGCGYACTPFFSKEVIIIRLNLNSVDQGVFGDDAKVQRMLEFLKEDAKRYCASKLGQVPDTFWIFDDSDNQRFEATFNGQNPGWQISQNIVGAQYKQTQLDRAFQSGGPLLRGMAQCFDSGSIEYKVTVDASELGVFLDSQKTLSVLDEIRQKNVPYCRGQSKLKNLAYWCDNGNQYINVVRRNDNTMVLNASWTGAQGCGQPRTWQVHTNVILQARLAELERQRKESVRSNFLSEFGVQRWAQTQEIIANPFVFKNTVVGVRMDFARMLSEDVAVFAFNGELLVAGTPSTKFRGNENVVLAVKILGTKAIKTAGGEITLPYGQYVGVYQCRPGCADFYN